MEKESKRSLIGLIGGFLGRSIGNIVLGFLRALIQASVLAYPLKWLWNDLVAKTASEEFVLLDFAMAFKILLLFSFITKMSVTRKMPNEEVIEV